MSFFSNIFTKNSNPQNKIWAFSILIGIIIGSVFAATGIVLFSKQLAAMKLKYIVVCLLLGVISGGVIGWFGQQILMGMINFISIELEERVGLQKKTFTSDKTGISREIDIFEQMFNLVVSVLKRVLIISFRLEEASSDLDQTAQVSSQVIKEIVERVEQINKSAVENAANLRETLVSLENSFNITKDISEKLNKAKEDSQNVSRLAESTQSSVKEAVEKMIKIKELTEGSANLVNDLNDRSKQIGAILTEIANIAEKTNLLALNAAIEAARAGEQGRGFAVVAEEVRKLARGSAESSKKINNLINDILQKTENAAEMMKANTTKVYEGMDVINIVNTSLTKMVETAQSLNQIIVHLSNSAMQQSQTADLMYNKVTTISNITDKISQQIQNVANTALGKTVIVDQTSSSAKELRTLSDVFQNALVPFKFKIEGANKRAFVRTEARIPCKFKMLLTGELPDSALSTTDYDLRGIITNLSAGGCVVETTEDIEQGKYAVFSFQLGNNFLHGIQGRLVRLKKLTSEEADALGKTTYEAVISFNNLPPDYEKIIVEYVLNAQKQFEQALGIES